MAAVTAPATDLHSCATRRIVLHADDFGFSQPISDGIWQAGLHGGVTATSLLANGPDAARAIALFQTAPVEEARPRIRDLGVHLNLTQGRPLTGPAYPAHLLDQHGRLPGIGPVFLRLQRPRSAVLAAIRTELAAQIEFVIDRGHRPSHLNGHQYVELIPAVGELVLELAMQFAIPVIRTAAEPDWLRTSRINGTVAGMPLAFIKQCYAAHFHRRVIAAGFRTTAAFFGTNHAGRVTDSVLRAFLEAAPPGQLSEIGLHPGLPGHPDATTIANGWNDPLSDHRPLEFAYLCSPELQSALRDSHACASHYD